MRDVKPVEVDIDLAGLRAMKLAELYEKAKGLGIEEYQKLKKSELVQKIVAHQAKEEGLSYSEGILDVHNDGYGFIRSADYNYYPGTEDVYVPNAEIRRNRLKTGDEIAGFIRLPREGERYSALVKTDMVNGVTLDNWERPRPFEKLTPYYPTKKIALSGPDNTDISMRILDLFCPVGLGQRALVVAPPRAGKTIFLQKMAKALERHKKEIHLIILLIDERPEEVTEMKRLVDAEIIASTFDQPAEKHVYVADVVLERAKRLVECGKNVVILLDSITRMSRAHNTILPHSGRTLSGGLDSNALMKPKKFFGAARNIEDGGSLTVIGTTLVETGSRMDDVIFEEFKGTGNMELVLNRRLADRRVFPAIDLNPTFTRREDLLLTEYEMAKVWLIRKYLADRDAVEAMEFLLDKMKMTKTNDEFIEMLDAQQRETRKAAQA